MTTTAAPQRRTVATFDNYLDAQRAVDRLSDEGFPVERVAIVGQGLRLVEQVAGRMTTGRAALLGAANGAWLGTMLGLLVWLVFSLDPDPALPLIVLYGLVSGAILGAVFGALAHAATRGERDFASVRGMQAERYEIQVDVDVADRAAELLRSVNGAGGSRPAAT
jgi:hypothetical protein